MTAGRAPLRVVHVTRKADCGVSIQNLFATLRGAMPADIDARPWFSPTQGPAPNRVLHNLAAAKRQGSAEDDIVHVVGDNYYLALAYPSRKVVLTIHDLVMLQAMSGWRKRYFETLWFRWPLRRASAVTAISGHVADEIAEHFDYPRERIEVVPNCVDARYAEHPRPFDTDRPVWLQVGTKWNKNVERLIEAAAGLAMELRVVGTLSAAQRALAAERGVEAVELGRLGDHAMAAAYRDCDALAFVSLDEGFGMPIIEAQATGRCVLTSRRPPMSDVADGGAWLVDPESVPAIRAGLERIMADAAERSRLLAAGQANAARYTPPRVAEQYAAIYRRVAGEGSVEGEGAGR